MQKISPCLWFDDKAEEAAKFYTSLFKNSKIGKTVRYDKAAAAASGMPEGSILTVAFTLEGQEFLALNGGPAFKFTEAVSFMVSCEDQAEIDKFWNTLIADGGEESQCGWLKDKYGLSWQIVPKEMDQLVSGDDAAGSRRAMEAMLAMKKLDIAKLKAAYAGK